MNNNSNNYVSPDKVDLEKADLNQASDILNRERTNIVSATLQANNAIDENQAKTVNNAIKVKKKNKFLSAIIVILSLAFGASAVFVLFKYAKEFIEAGDVSTTTKVTTTQNMYTRVSKYLKDYTRVRRFETSDRIILLLPNRYDLLNDNLYYLNIMKNDSGIIKESYSTYSIIEDELILKDTNEVFKITEGGISSEDVILNIADIEFKYYYYNEPDRTKLLVMNGTPGAETCLYLTSTKESTSVTITKATEGPGSIILESGEIFVKSSETEIMDDVTLKLVE